MEFLILIFLIGLGAIYVVRHPISTLKIIGVFVLGLILFLVGLLFLLIPLQ